jgi:hypothetical protein
MNIGKREQIVLISIGTLVAIFLIHSFIFKPKSEEYARVQNDFQQGQNTLKDAERPPSPNYIPNFAAQTEKYESQLSSVVAQLKLDRPAYYANTTNKNMIKRIDEVTEQMHQLVQLRQKVRVPQLTFLDDRRQVQSPIAPQQGWNLPATLPNVGAAGALWDTVVKINDQFTLMNNIQDPVGYMQQRQRYNQLVATVGINPAEVCDWVINLPQAGGYVFFNDQKYVQMFPAGQAVANPLSTNRFGPLVPSLKKLWMSQLIWDKHDPRSNIPEYRLRQILEVDIPTGNTLLMTSKQLQALIEIIGLAEQNGILEISKVDLMKSVPIGKSFHRIPGQTPPPSASPTAAAAAAVSASGEPTFFGSANPGAVPGMPQAQATPSETVGTGTGIELWFRGDNSKIIKFLFDITHTPRTYALDDLHLWANPTGVLETSTTVEVVTALDSVKK